MGTPYQTNVTTLAYALYSGGRAASHYHRISASPNTCSKPQLLNPVIYNRTSEYVPCHTCFTANVIPWSNVTLNRILHQWSKYPVSPQRAALAQALGRKDEHVTEKHVGSFQHQSRPLPGQNKYIVINLPQIAAWSSQRTETCQGLSIDSCFWLTGRSAKD